MSGSENSRSIYAIQPVSAQPRELSADIGDFFSGVWMLIRFVFGLVVLAALLLNIFVLQPQLDQRAREYERQGIPYGYTTGASGMRTGIVPLGPPRNSSFRD